MDDSPNADPLHESLRELAQTVGDAVKVDVGPIREELALVKSLLQDAGRQLQGSFLRLNTSARAQLAHVTELHENARLRRQGTPDALSDDAEAVVRAELEQFRQISQQVGSSIDDAVQALQFEDMATQLIDCVQRRIVRLDAVAIRLEAIVLHFERAPQGDAVLAQAELHTQLTSLKNEYATALVSPVATEGLAGGGTIDLF